ncbi:hypothetical protein HaLaN_30608 [Haematococcus lacustris]|uniref:Uncharacterized protein n=1 Tax=Haematococcus lacustris TaxID=44745 RepID=A0A6A0AFX9_HAELA|nr:hypothetical protein HaLaN_30608 [Haematococcus lacustris]
MDSIRQQLASVGMQGYYNIIMYSANKPETLLESSLLSDRRAENPSK